MSHTLGSSCPSDMSRRSSILSLTSVLQDRGGCVGDGGAGGTEAASDRTVCLGGVNGNSGRLQKFQLLQKLKTDQQEEAV